MASDDTSFQTGASRKWWRIPILAIGVYLLISVLGNAALWLGVAAGRVLDRDPRARDPDLPGIRHLRKVDNRLWAGAQPSMDDYRGLAELGVTVVVDARTGRAGDPRLDDPAFLNDLGIDYEWLPVADGQAPDAATVRRFVEIVDSSTGIVFMHCGGGVGRSTSFAAAYEASQGGNPSLLEQMAVGPMSPEQAWFIAAVGRDEPHDANVVIQSVSRYVVDAPRVLWHKLTD